MNQKFTLLGAIVLISGISIFNACTKIQKGVAIKSPFKDVEVPMRDLEVDAEKGGSIAMPNGTVINIPANCFTDANGKLVKGKVSLKYREFHSSADIIASGIPMNYDSAGQSHNFASAGMFELRGFAENKPLNIAEGKSVEVNMASFKKGEEYNFYGFNENNNSWEFKGDRTSTVNQKKLKEMQTIAVLPNKPLQPQEADINTPVMDLDVDYSQYPELKEFNGLMWQYAGTDPAKDPFRNQGIFNQSCANMKLDLKDSNTALFNLTLECGESKFKTEVKPVLRGKKYEEALAKFKTKMTYYDQVCTKRASDIQRLASEADLVRSFQLKNFGIYNWDALYKGDGMVRVAANFDFDMPVNKGEITVYEICGNNNAVVYYYPGSWEMFSYNPANKNTLVAIMPGDKLAVFTSEDFSRLNRAALAKENRHTFKLRTIDKKITSIADLNSVLESI